MADANEVVMWEHQEHWNIAGTTERNMCMASATYSEGRYELILSLMSNGVWAFSFRDDRVEMTVGLPYKVIVQFDSGPSTILEGPAIDKSQVVIAMPDEMLGAFAIAKKVTFEGFGSFPLTGSSKAIQSIVQCAEVTMLKGDPT